VAAVDAPGTVGLMKAGICQSCYQVAHRPRSVREETPEESFDVPVSTMLPVAVYRRMARLAERTGTSVGSLVAECVRRVLAGQMAAPVPAPLPASTPSGRNPRRAWTAEDDVRVREWHALGWSDSRMAREMGASQPTVSLHRRALGLPNLFKAGFSEAAS